MTNEGSEAKDAARDAASRAFRDLRFVVIPRTLLVVGVVLGITSLLNYYDVFVAQGIYPILEGIVSTYRVAVHKVFGFLDNPLKDIANFVAVAFQLTVEVQPYWKDIFVPIWLYFAMLASASRGDGRTAYRMSLFVCGFVFAVFFGVFLATLGTELSATPALVALVTGVLLYEFAAYALLLPLVKKENRKLAPRFWRYVVEKPLTSVIVGLLATVVFSFRSTNNENATAFALIFFILLLGFRDMTLAIYFSVQNRGRLPGTFGERLFNSRSWKLGILVVAIIFAASFGIAQGG